MLQPPVRPLCLELYGEERVINRDGAWWQSSSDIGEERWTGQAQGEGDGANAGVGGSRAVGVEVVAAMSHGARRATPAKSISPFPTLLLSCSPPRLPVCPEASDALR